MRATSSGSGSDMSSSLRPMVRPTMSIGYDDAPLQMMQRNMMLGPFASDPRLNMAPFSNDVRGPDRIIGVPDPETVTSGLIPRIPTFEEFLMLQVLRIQKKTEKFILKLMLGSMGG